MILGLIFSLALGNNEALLRFIFQKLQERNDMQCRAMASLEERCASLKSTVEQLHIALEKASNTESELKNEINSLQHSIMELTATLQASNEKNKQVGT